VTGAMDEWSVFKTAHPHALIIGSQADAQARLADHVDCLRAPVVQWRPRLAAEPPPATGTLLIWDIEVLDRTQQELFLSWMDGHPGVQVVSIAERPLFPLVLNGTFLDRLYYRLNVLCLSPSESDHRSIEQSPVPSDELKKSSDCGSLTS
jgi:hypothetical protein